MPDTPRPDTQPQFYAGVTTKRFFAWVVDTLLILVACVIVIPFTAFTGLFFLPLLWLSVSFVYRLITLANGSATWGMRLMGIELRTGSDAHLDGATAFAHTLGYSVSVAMAPLQLISIILMCTSSRGQGLTDMVLGTVALNRRVGL